MSQFWPKNGDGKPADSTGFPSPVPLYSKFLTGQGDFDTGKPAIYPVAVYIIDPAKKQLALRVTPFLGSCFPYALTIPYVFYRSIRLFIRPGRTRTLIKRSR